MKKLLSIMALMLCGALCACGNNPAPSQKPTETTQPTQNPTQTPAQTEQATATAAPTSAETKHGFLTITDVGLERVTLQATDSLYSYAYALIDGFTGKKTVSIAIDSFIFNYEEPDYTINTSLDNASYVLVVNVNGEFEDDESYASSMELTITFDDGTTAHVEELTSYDCELG